MRRSRKAETADAGKHRGALHWWRAQGGRGGRSLAIATGYKVRFLGKVACFGSPSFADERGFAPTDLLDLRRFDIERSVLVIREPELVCRAG